MSLNIICLLCFICFLIGFYAGWRIAYNQAIKLLTNLKNHVNKARQTNSNHQEINGLLMQELIESYSTIRELKQEIGLDNSECVQDNNQA